MKKDKTNTINMTNGTILPQIIQFMLPIFFSNLIQQLFNIVDAMMIGQFLGIEALAGIGASLPIYSLIILISITFAHGLSIITSQMFGANDTIGFKNSITTGLFLILSCTSIYGIINYFTLDAILEIMNVPIGIRPITKEYCSVLCFSVVIIALLNILFSYLRAIGNSKTPLYFLIFSSLLNIILNYIFMKYLNMGVKGSAYGTALSFLITTILCLYYIIKKYKNFIPQKENWQITFSSIKKHLWIAVPMVCQYSIIVLSIAIVQTACNNLGSDYITGMTIGLRLEILTAQMLNAIGLATITFVAQNYGAKKLSRIKKGVSQVSILSFSIAVFLAILTYLFEDNLISLFLNDDNPEKLDTILNLAKQYINISIIFYIFVQNIKRGE